MMSLYNGRNDNMIIRDNYDVNDSLVNGLCIARTPDGKVLFKKHNMVVNGGRDAILSTMLAETKISFTRIAFGNNISMTTRETTSISGFKHGDEDVYSYNVVDSASGIDDKSVSTYVVDGENRSIKFSVPVKASNPAEICEMGLFFKLTDSGGEDGEENLFSRVVFDPIFCGPNAAVSSFTIDYVVYL